MNKAGLLYSGGKDSSFALHLSIPKYSVVCLITIEPKEKESFLFHVPNIWVTKFQSKALGIPQIYRSVGGFESEIEVLREAVLEAKEKYKIDTIITGGVKSNFQKSRFESVLTDLGLGTTNPLWGIDEEAYLSTLLDEGFVFIMTSVSALGLGKEWLGREFDRNAVRELVTLSKKYGFNSSLEGGEGETLVLDMPEFTKRLVLSDVEVIWEGDRGFLKINSVTLKEKN
jgi:diphthine-ammonia ligase